MRSVADGGAVGRPRVPAGEGPGWALRGPVSASSPLCPLCQVPPQPGPALEAPARGPHTGGGICWFSLRFTLITCVVKRPPMAETTLLRESHGSCREHS